MPRDDSSLPSTLTDLAELGRLLDEHRPRLLAMVRRRLDPSLGVRIDPEDVLAEAFLDARRRWAAFAPSGRSAYAWLYRLVLDRIIEEWRKATRGRRNLHREVPWPDQTSEQLALNLMQAGTSPSAAADRQELRERAR